MTFDTYDTDSIITGGITFSGGNLVAQATAGGLFTSRIAQAIEGKKSGKWYVEFTCGGVSGNVDGVGVVNSIGTPSFIGDGGPFGYVPAVGIGYYTNDHVTAKNSLITHVNGGTFTTGDVIGVAIDLDNAKIWWRKNTGGWVGTTGTPDPATNTNGIDISDLLLNSCRVYPGANLSGNGAKFTANFGASAFTGSVPSGFTSGWTNTATTPTFGSFASNGFGQVTNAPPTNDLSVSKYVSNFNGNVGSVIAPFERSTSLLKCVIYDDTGTGGLPGALLGVSNVENSGSPGEKVFSGFTPAVHLTNGSSYYIGFISTASTSFNNIYTGGTAAAGIWFVAGTYASPDNPFPSSPSTVNFRYPLMVFKSTASTETGTGTLAFSGFSFSGTGGHGGSGSGVLAFSGFSFVAAGVRIHVTGTGVLAFSGITIVSSGFDFGAAGTGGRWFWTR